jgi:hypothetical protein
MDHNSNRLICFSNHRFDRDPEPAVSDLLLEMDGTTGEDNSVLEFLVRPILKVGEGF